MRKRILLIAVPLVVVAIAAGVAVAAPSDAEHQRGDRLDELHAERPIAASDSNADLSLTEAGFQQAAKNIVDYVRFVEFTRWIDSQIVGDYIVSVAAAEAAQAAQAAAPRYSPRSSGSVYSDSNPGGFLSCVRQRESGGNYGIYNSGGSGAAGAYQFMPGTWNSIASSSGRGDLVGVDPAQASPADQDAMAQALYAQQGSAPWGGAC
jgi:hypothetical protein